MASIAHVVLDLVTRYGYVAVFVYMLLETAFILHFAPSELVVPFAASQLVHGPLSFVAFVVDTTAGATAGSILMYYVFARYGKSALKRYGRYIRVSEEGLERSQRWFERWGTGSVFWGRMLPLIRALISVPAGLAEMEFRRFVVYSAVGAGMFNITLTYLTYNGANGTSPLGLVASLLNTEGHELITYLVTRRAFVAVVALFLVVVVGAAWWRRTWIRQYPERAIIAGLYVLRALCILSGVLLVVGALSSPEQAFAAITWIWDDPGVFVHLGFTQQVALMLTGVALVGGGIVVFELRRALRRVEVEALFG